MEYFRFRHSGGQYCGCSYGGICCKLINNIPLSSTEGQVGHIANVYSMVPNKRIELR